MKDENAGELGIKTAGKGDLGCTGPFQPDPAGFGCLT